MRILLVFSVVFVALVAILATNIFGKRDYLQEGSMDSETSKEMTFKLVKSKESAQETKRTPILVPLALRRYVKKNKNEKFIADGCCVLKTSTGTYVLLDFTGEDHNNYTSEELQEIAHEIRQTLD
ncbi:Protein CBG27942 [Caenorhabditis briggsae]|uniref:Protein CBG27942 n=1 Tax=Caenorhabditis briggsae TaxID=6238 RepID=B6IJN4_CAEBR|nr:Protein CBG27942 [Caenorhabditis briggsae]CAS00114.1 Protein CBG27942 [Caenorhabditis briggsae]